MQFEKLSELEESIGKAIVNAAMIKDGIKRIILLVSLWQKK